MIDKLVETVKGISNITIERTGKKAGRSLHITGASCMGNLVVGTGKLLMGIVSLSFFTCASALYTFGMVAAKGAALTGIVKEDNQKGQYRYYKIAGMILIVSSLLYILYSLRLLLNPVQTSYHEYIALGIATFTFTELVLNIRGVIVERHNHTPLIHAIKMINLASSLICLVLTHTAILAMSSDEVDLLPQTNGRFGILMGAAATIIGIIMLLQVMRMEQGKNYGAAYHNLKKMMHKNKIAGKIKPLYYIENNECNNELYVQIKKDLSQEEFEELKMQAEDQLQLYLGEEKEMEKRKMGMGN